MRARWVFGVIAALVLLAVAFLLGGGVYRTVNAGGGRVYVVNRFTGSERLLGVSAARRSQEVETLPLSAIARLEGSASISGDSLYCELYNGSDWDVKELTISVSATLDDGRKLDGRRYNLSKAYAVGSLESGTWSCNLGLVSGFGPAPISEWSWGIVSARGKPHAPE